MNFVRPVTGSPGLGSAMLGTVVVTQDIVTARGCYPACEHRGHALHEQLHGEYLNS